jgi:hypothetical protein
MLRSSTLQDRRSTDNQQRPTTSTNTIVRHNCQEIWAHTCMLDRLDVSSLLDGTDDYAMESDSPLGRQTDSWLASCSSLYLKLSARLQSASENQTSLIRSLKEEVAKLTKKMSRFSSSLSSVRFRKWRSFSNDLLSWHCLFCFFSRKNNSPFIKIQMTKRTIQIRLSSFSSFIWYHSIRIQLFFRIMQEKTCWTSPVVIQEISHEKYCEDYSPAPS